MKILLRNTNVRVLGACLIGLVSMFASPARTQVPRFDVVSVKPNRAGPGPRDAYFEPDGRFVAVNAPVHELISIAYGEVGPLLDFQIAGGPDWTIADRFDVRAIPEERSGAATNEPTPHMRMMLRSLLADRFKLVTHNESRELPVYTLTLDRSDRRLGPRLRPSTLDCRSAAAAAATPSGPAASLTCGVMIGPGSLMSGGTTLEVLSKVLAGFVGRSVIDRTGLTGSYDASLEFVPDFGSGMPAGALPPGSQPPPVNGLSVFTAVREQLGLRLEPGRGPVNVLVIDRIEAPTPD